MKLLVVGLGSMGKRRARLIKNLGHTVYGVDNSPARVEEGQSQGIAAFGSLDAALAENRYDAAFVCTAPLTHAIVIDSLLDAGLPVFTELNLVADGYEGLCAKAREKGLLLFLSSTMLYRGEPNFIIDSVRDFGGPVNYIYHIGQYLPDWHPWESYKSFFLGEKRTGGVREIFGIELPWLVTAFGPVETARAEHDRLTKLDLPYPDSCFVNLRHKNGTRGFLAADVVTPKPVRNFEVYGEGLHLFWEGSPHALYRYDAAAKEKVPVNTYEKAEHDPRYSDNVVETAFVDEILYFFEVLAGRAEPKWTFEKDLEVIKLMDALEADAGGEAAE